jgi:PRTRC genetic system protein E
MFWKHFSGLINGYTVQLTIKNEGEKMIVMLVPKLDTKKDEVQKELLPIVITATAEQLDEQFFLAVEAGLRKTTQLQSNIAEFEKSVDKASTKLKPAGKAEEKKKSAQTSMDLENKEKAEEAEDPEDDDRDPENVTENPPFIADEKPSVDTKETEKPKTNSVKPGKSEKLPKEKKPDPATTPDTEPEEKKIVLDTDEFGDDNW